ncbi:unnamed protein product, partial [Pocillopora meandrina]
MARDVQENNIYQRKSKLLTLNYLPVKWTAFEALLHGKYSTKSDASCVESSCSISGGSPYPRMDRRQVLTLLEAGYRMPKPQHVGDKLYEYI